MTPIPFDAIIFDVDGTLFQTEKVALPAYRGVFAALQEQGLYDGEMPAEEKILSTFGMTIPEVWETLLPDRDIKVRDKANELLAQQEIHLMKEGTGELYPGVQEALKELHDSGIKIYTASNGEKRYVETVIETQRLVPFFTKLYTAGAYKTEKKDELVAILLREQHIRSAVMVGDRRSDIDAGRSNDLPTIGCDFGFADKNELKHADLVIDRFDQLLDALRSIKVKKNEESTASGHANE